MKWQYYERYSLANRVWVHENMYFVYWEPDNQLNLFKNQNRTAEPPATIVQLKSLIKIIFSVKRIDFTLIYEEYGSNVTITG